MFCADIIVAFCVRLIFKNIILSLSNHYKLTFLNFSVSTEQTSAVFEQLCRLVKPVVNPGDCSSAERCILVHLHDLYSACIHLRSKTHQAEPFSNAYPKIRSVQIFSKHFLIYTYFLMSLFIFRQVLYANLQPVPSNFVCNPQFLSEVFTNPHRGGNIS